MHSPPSDDLQEPPDRVVTPARGYLLALATGLLLYIFSVAPTVLWQDSGTAQLRVLRHDVLGQAGLALSHPLYYIIAIAFQHLPLAESALKTNLVSAVFGAITVANIFLLIRLATGAWRPAMIGAISLGVAHTFWQHCALAEVYSLTTALLSAELLCALRFHRTGQARWLIMLFLFNGLGISNHMLASLTLACWCGWMVHLLVKRRIAPRLLPGVLGAWIAGAGIYLYLIISSIAAGESVAAALQSALFGGYRHSVLNLLPSARQLANSAMYLSLNYPTPAVLLVIPAIALLRSHRLLPGIVWIAGAVHLIWAIRYDVPDQYTFFIPSLVFISVLIGLGAHAVLQRGSRARMIGLTAAAILPVAVYAPLPAVARALHLDLGLSREVPYRDEYDYFLHPWKAGYRGAERFASEVMLMLPDGAVLIADGTAVRPIHYLQLTGRWKSGATILPEAAPDDQPPRRISEESLLPELNRGLVYVVTPARTYCPDWLLDRYNFTKEGVLYRVTSRKGHAASSASAPSQ